MARFTKNGFERDGIVAIRNKLNIKAQEMFAPILNGEELSVDDSGILGRIFGIVAEPISDLEESVQDFVMTFDPNQVYDTQLDDFLALHADMRMDSLPATAPLLLFGNLNGTVLEGSTARSSITGDIFSTLSTVVFSSENCNGVEISMSDPVGITTYSLMYSVSTNASVNPPIVISSLQGETVKEVAARMSQTINSQTSDLTAFVTNDNKVNVYITNRFAVGDFYAGNNVTIEASYMPVDSRAVTYTAVGQGANSITSIMTGANVDWISVTNPYETYPSSPVESDEDARHRWYTTKSKDGFGEYDHIQGALLRLDGVRFVNIQQNIASTSIGERTNQGVSIIVLGGDPNRIAQAIFNNISAGTVTNGDLTHYAQDIKGNAHKIKFSRPSYAEISISMSIKALPNFPTNGKNIIKQRIVDWFNRLEVGEDILYSRLFDPINSVSGFSAKNLQVGRVGGNIGVNDVTIKYNELATIKPENILIGGS